MSLLPLNPPAGLYRNGTRLQAAGRWYLANLVRFVDGTVRPVGGWVAYALGAGSAAVVGKVRTVLSWRSNDNAAILALGTASGLYAMVNRKLYDITPVGLVAGLPNTGGVIGAYGKGVYGAGNYGKGDAATAPLVEAGVWRLDTFGEWLVGVLAPSDGRLVMWDRDITHKATVVAEAPTGAVGVVITAERFPLLLGCNGYGGVAANPRLVRWPDIETLTDWTPTETNTAGEFELMTEGKIVTGRRVRGRTLVWTDVDVHAIDYVGPPLQMGRERLGAGGIVGPNAVAVMDKGAVWMSHQSFMAYDGFVAPLPCDVADAVFSDFNRGQAALVNAVVQSEFGEVWWFYPSAGSSENDRYVVWNYRENHWTTGALARAGGVDRGVFTRPMFVAADGTIYEHEQGYAYGGLVPFVESGPLELTGGERVMVCTQLVPDEKTLGDVRAWFYLTGSPTGAEQVFGPYPLAESTDVRFTAREVRLRLEGVRAADWRVGVLKLDAVPGGRR